MYLIVCYHLPRITLAHVSTLFLCGFLLLENPSFSADSNSNRLLGKPAPSFSLLDEHGNERKLSDWKNSVIVINFWATWCAPCKKEIPLLNKTQIKYEEDGLQIIGIAIDNLSSVKKFTSTLPLEYPSLLSGVDATRIINKFGNKAGVLPYTVIINRQGKIVEIASGLLTKKYLHHAIEKYL